MLEKQESNQQFLMPKSSLQHISTAPVFKLKTEKSIHSKNKGFIMIHKKKNKKFEVTFE